MHFCVCYKLYIFVTVLQQASPEELMVMTVTEIIQELIQAHQEGKDVNLNRLLFCHLPWIELDVTQYKEYLCFFIRLKTKIASKYSVPTQPRLVDIIAAVPAQYRKVLLPKLKAKPVRTASGVCQLYCWLLMSMKDDKFVYPSTAVYSFPTWSKNVKQNISHCFSICQLTLLFCLFFRLQSLPSCASLIVVPIYLWQEIFACT